MARSKKRSPKEDPDENGVEAVASNFQRGLPQIVAVGVKNLLLFGYGMTLGFPTIVIPAIQGGEGRDPHHDIVLNRDQISWFSSINLLCVPLGCIFSGMFTQPIGKRRAMQFVNLPILGSWILFYFSTNIWHLYAGLCLFGLSGGLMEAPVLTYVAEITEPRFRGMLAATGSTCVILGVFIQFLLASFFTWRTIAAMSTVLPILSILALFIVPESPHWLMTQGRYAEAEKALAWLRGWVPVHQVKKEYDEIYDILVRAPAQAILDERPNGSCPTIARYRKRSFLLPYALITLTFFIGHFSGKTTLQTYAVQIFHTLKAPIDKYYATILLGAAEIVGTLFCVVLVHYTGKRPLVLTSIIGSGLCFLGTATYAHFLDSIPGVAVENVVANVSSLDQNPLSLISSSNITAELDQLKWLTHSSNITTDLEQQEWSMHSKENQPSNITLYLVDNETDSSQRMVREIINNYTFSAPDLNDTINHYPENTHLFQIQSNTTGDENDEITVIEDLQDIPLENPEYITINELKINSNLTSHTNFTTYPDVTKESLLTEELQDIPQEIVLKIPHVEENRFIWLPLTLLLLSAMFAHMGIKLIPWMLIGEVFPASVRSGASGISSGTGYIFGFLANKLFLGMLATMTMPGTFWFYSAVALIGGCILFFVLPETEGRSLLEIERHFSGGEPWQETTHQRAATALNTSRNHDRLTDVVAQPANAGRMDLRHWKNNGVFQRHLDEKRARGFGQAQGKAGTVVGSSVQFKQPNWKASESIAPRTEDTRL